MTVDTDRSSLELDIGIDEIPVGSLRLVRAGGRRICLVRTAEGIHALDHACPHEGYGLTQGQLDGELLTCAWHNWKFRVSDGACVKGEEDVTTHDVAVGDDGRLAIRLNQPDPMLQKSRLRSSLQRAIERDYIGQISRDVVRLLQTDENPGELVWEAVAHGAPRGEFGWGHSIASATDCLGMLDLYDGDQRALPVVQAIAGIAESNRGRPEHRLPDPVTSLPAIPPPHFARSSSRSVSTMPRPPCVVPSTPAAAPPSSPGGSPASSPTITCRTDTARSTARRRSSCWTCWGGTAPTRCCPIS